MVHTLEKPDRDKLINLYDVVNEIFKDKNVDVFYTSEQVEERRKAGGIFL